MAQVLPEVAVTSKLLVDWWLRTMFLYCYIRISYLFAELDGLSVALRNALHPGFIFVYGCSHRSQLECHDELGADALLGPERYSINCLDGRGRWPCLVSCQVEVVSVFMTVASHVLHNPMQQRHNPAPSRIPIFP